MAWQARAADIYVFVDADLSDDPRRVVAMEVCASVHSWGRETERPGHEVKPVLPIDVKPFVKRDKNAAAEATCEAARRPTMSVVVVKTEERQARGMLLRTRDLLVRQRTRTIDALRGRLTEFGVVAAQGPAHVSRPASALGDPGSGLPEPVGGPGRLLLDRIVDLDGKIGGLDRERRACARRDEEAARLMTIPGAGPVTAMALQAFAPAMESFRRGRDVAARLGPGKISKMGRRDLGRLLVIGAMAEVGWAVRCGKTKAPRIIRAPTMKKEIYRAPAAA